MSTNRKVFWLFIVGILTLVVVLGSWLFSEESQPVSQGRKLSEWAQAVHFQDWDSSSSMHNDSIKAIREIGTNAIPYAIRWLTADSREKVKEKCAALVEKFNDSQSWFNFDTKRLNPPPRWIWSMGIFHALRTKASSAIPELIPLLEGPDSSASSIAAEALLLIGVESIPAFSNALISTNRNVVELSIYSLLSLGTNSLSTAPILLGYLRRDYLGLGDRCAWALSAIDPDSQEFLQALIQRIETSYPKPSLLTYLALETLGTNAVATAPLLINIIESADSPLKNRRAVQVLCKIAPLIGEPYAIKIKAEIEARETTNQPPQINVYERYLGLSPSTNALNTNDQNRIKPGLFCHEGSKPSRTRVTI